MATANRLSASLWPWNRKGMRFHRRQRRPRPSARLRFERLEDRSLLSAGSLDLTFGNAGRILTDFGDHRDNYAYDAAVQSDGKIVAVGFHRDDGGSDFAVARYNLNGDLDTSFGNGGVAVTDFGVSTEYAIGVVIQPDGKIVVSGGSIWMPMGYMAVARYLPNGQPDPNFGDQGKVMLNFDIPVITEIVPLLSAKG